MPSTYQKTPLRLTKVSSLALLSAALFAAPAVAGDKGGDSYGKKKSGYEQGMKRHGSDKGDQKSQRSDMNRSQQQQQAGRTLTGTVVQTKEVRRRDTGKTNLVAQIERQNGERIIVDLGNTDQWYQDDFQNGDRVSISGNPGRVGNRLVYFAKTATIDNEQVKIERDPGNRKSKTQNDSRQIEGQVSQTRQMNVRGQDTQTVWALITTDQGNYVVDLGEARDFSASDLNNQTVSARGRDVRVRDRIVFLTDQFRMNGQTYTALRPARVIMGYARNESAQSGNQQSGRR